MKFTHSPYEREMKTIPHIPKEKSLHEALLNEIVLHRTCQFCLLFSQSENRCCFITCPHIKERIKSNTITFSELLPHLVFKTNNKELKVRLINMYRQLKGGSITSMYKNDIHKKVFENQIEAYKKEGYLLSNRFVAALFIISANSFLWKACRKHIKPNTIDFSKIDVKGIETDSYLLLKVAKDLYSKQHQVSASDLADKSLTRDYVFNIVVTGILVARYGYDTLKLEIKPKEDECENE